MKRSSPSRLRFRPTTESLEDRRVLSVTIQIDYSLDASGFFHDPTRRAILQTAADTLGSRLNDNLSAINPSGSNSWTANFDNPTTGVQTSINNMTVPANTLIVFVGGRPLTGLEIGSGEFGGFAASGSQAWLDLVGARGQVGALANRPTDFGPWGGAITFDTTSFNNPAKGYFALDASKLTSGEDDFLSVAFHEMEHLLGFGTAPSWQDQVTSVGGVPSSFSGPISNSLYDKPGPVPVSADGGHWNHKLQDGGSESVMTPELLEGTRKLPTRLDYAGLQDLGWAVTNDPDGTIAGAPNSTLNGLGLQSLTGLSIGPDTSDVDMFKISGLAGQVLNATTLARAGGTVVDTYLRIFDASGNELTHANNGVYDTLTMPLPTTGTYYVGISGVANTTYSATEDFARRLGGGVGSYDLNLSLNSATAGVTSDLTVQVAAPAVVTEGKMFVYTIGVTNHGTDSADSVHVTQALPASVTYVSSMVSQGAVSISGGNLNVNLGPLGVNAGAVIQVTVMANGTGPVSISAAVSATQADPNPADNQASGVTTIQPGVILPPADTTPPTIANVQILTTGKKGKKITTIVLTFSEKLDPAHAGDIGAFILSKAGKAKPHKPVPQLPLGIKSATYSADNRTIQLVTGLAGVLPKGLQLFVSAGSARGIRDLAGNLLDGRHNGSAGGDATLILH